MTNETERKKKTDWISLCLLFSVGYGIGVLVGGDVRNIHYSRALRDAEVVQKEREIILLLGNEAQEGSLKKVLREYTYAQDSNGKFYYNREK